MTGYYGACRKKKTKKKTASFPDPPRDIWIPSDGGYQLKRQYRYTDIQMMVKKGVFFLYASFFSYSLPIYQHTMG